MDRNLEDVTAFQPLGPAIRVLMVWPRFPASFWSLGEVMEIVPERSLVPPLGLITVAALCPKQWEIRLIDLAFEELRDEDLLWANLVMVSAMEVQRLAVRQILERASRLGRRTMVGGPYASSEPDQLVPLADHVVVGEPDEIFPEIAADLETGRARKMYRVTEKPDVSRTPVPRFDLLALHKYSSMSVQFSRGCPFTCEFCDIITLYGRRPRTKPPAQLIAELDALLQLGWRKEVFVVDDNFIGNHKAALELTLELERWQRRNQYPFAFFTEASIDLASRSELLDTMVRANFCRVFIGIETTSPESLKEVKKFQNLRRDPLDCIRLIQQQGLWVMGGFIVGFDSDPPDVFDRQIEFIERAAIPWAMTGVLQAPPTTPLYARMKSQGRIVPANAAPSNFNPPNFRTVLPLAELLGGTKRMLLTLYEPRRFYNRVFDSLERWQVQPEQKAPAHSLLYQLRVMFKSVWRQGVLSGYRRDYWRFVGRLMMRWGLNPGKRRMGFELAISGHHFIRYARQVAEILEAENRGATEFKRPGFVPLTDSPAPNLVPIDSVP
ncbi:MAG TPA: B12-binding domain-containing radical SAM protein [Candidatus Binataceae bacterium]|nr:B12-binding domain-containing radical SAM protein [Candidatus Binataceae bacterium]